MNINDLGKLLGKPPIKAPKPVKGRVNLDACARILAGAVTKAVADAVLYGIGTYETGRTPTRCPVCRQPHPPSDACKPLEAHDNGPRLEHKA